MLVVRNKSRVSWRPDVLVTDVGNRNWSASNTYRLTSNTNQHNHLEAVFRPSGFNKEYQYRVSFGKNNYEMTPQIEILAEQIDNNMNVMSARHLFSCGVKISVQSCPFCKSQVLFINHMWECRSVGCKFNYSKDTCLKLSELYESGQCKTRGMCSPSSFGVLGNASGTLSLINRVIGLDNET
jgi:hypothetical protein